jgi:hypothetical protein
MAFENLKVYGSKLPNYDEEAKIFYGVVAQNSLNSDVVSDILIGSDTLDLSYEEAIRELNARIEDSLGCLTDIYNLSVDIIGKHALKYSWEKENLRDIKEVLRFFKEEDFEAIKEILIEEFNNSYECDSPDFEYKDKEGYIIINCLDYNLMIIKSPYYCFAPECSPCVPCAGDLDSIIEGREYSKKTYCLGKDFYEDSKDSTESESNEPKHKIFEVATDKEVI